jgi:hypothetical protein
MNCFGAAVKVEDPITQLVLVQDTDNTPTFATIYFKSQAEMYLLEERCDEYKLQAS